VNDPLRHRAPAAMRWARRKDTRTRWRAERLRPTWRPRDRTGGEAVETFLPCPTHCPVEANAASRIVEHSGFESGIRTYSGTRPGTVARALPGKTRSEITPPAFPENRLDARTAWLESIPLSGSISKVERQSYFCLDAVLPHTDKDLTAMRQLWMYLPLILACTISLRAEDPPAAEFQVWSKAAGFVCPEITVQHHSPSDKGDDVRRGRFSGRWH
jgi:hypothetical protein